MATFPALKTNSVAQYPLKTSLHFHNQTVRFIDGKEQRYRDCAAALHVWTIQLDQLDETEMSSLEEFFQEVQGRYQDFAFVDPWDGCQYPTCSLMEDEMASNWTAEMAGQTTLTVVENRR